MQVVDRNGRLKVEITSTVEDISIGVTTISGGTSGRVLYDNAGVVGEIAGTSDQYIAGDGSLITFPSSLPASKMVTIGRNATGSTLYKGTIVYISGSTGNRPNFVKAQANAEATSAGTFGVIESDIPNNSDGNCVTIGTIDNLDTRSTATNPFTTDTLADGDTIYLSPTTEGYVTNVKPYAPSHLVYIGKVVRTSPTNGTIVYRIQNGYELDELHDVAAQTPSNNDVLSFETSTQLWKPKSIPTLLGFTPVPTTRTISTTAPLSGGGDLSADRTLSIATANTTTTGALSSTDWNTFNDKQSALISGTNIKTINGNTILGAGDLVISTGITIGTTAITSGTVGRVLFEGTGSVVQESANLFWDNTNGRLGIGGTPSTFNLDNVGTTRLQGNLTMKSNQINWGTDFATNSIVLYDGGSATNRIGYGVSGSSGGGVLFSRGGGLWIGMAQDASSMTASNAFISLDTTKINVNKEISTTYLGNVLTYGNTTTTRNGIGITAGVGTQIFAGTGNNIVFGIANDASNLTLSNSALNIFSATKNIGINTGTDAGYKLDVNGSGRYVGTGTNALLLNGDGLTVNAQNHKVALSATTNGITRMYLTSTASGASFNTGFSLVSGTTSKWSLASYGTSFDFTFYNDALASDALFIKGSTNNVILGSTTDVASALLNVTSTTKGFLPPRGTNTQMLAIATPASGLMFIDNTTSTNNILNLYNGTGWGSVLTSNPTVTASAALGRGFNYTPALTAAANNDVLVGLDINPTFTNGAFTTTRNIGLRVQNGRVVIGSPAYDVSDYPASLLVASNYTLYGTTPQHGGLWVTEANSGNFANIRFYSNGTPTFVLGRTGTTYTGMSNKSFLHSTSDLWFTASSSGYPDSTGHVMVMFQSTRNIGINTTTDAGYKLDVNGTARVSGAFLQGSGSSFTSGISSTSSSSQAFIEISGASGNNSSLAYSKGGSLSTIWQVYTDSSNNYAVFRNGLNREIFKIFESTKNVGIDEVAAAASFNDISSAKLFVNSTTKGFLPPRMTTTERDAIASPATGLQIYNTTTNTNDTYKGTAWESEVSGSISSASGNLFNYYNFT